MDFKDNVPIYLQIIGEIKRRIVSGEWLPGSRVPPVRELAQGFGVNPNTMQRALAELERIGLLYAERTAGRFVSSDAEKISSIRNEMAEEYVCNFIVAMNRLGYEQNGIKEIISRGLEEHGS